VRLGKVLRPWGGEGGDGKKVEREKGEHAGVRYSESHRLGGKGKKL